MADKPSDIAPDPEIGDAIPGGQESQAAAAAAQPRAATPSATLVPNLDKEAGDFLDSLAHEATKGAAGTPPAKKEDEEDEDPAAAAAAALEAAKAKDAKPGEAKPAEVKPGDVVPKVGDPKPGDVKPAADAKAAEVKPVKDVFDAVVMPPNVKPKTGEAFENLKVIAREKVAEVTKTADELRKKNEELEKQLKDTVSAKPEDLKELEELRKERRFSNLEKAPEFVEFDTKIGKATDVIYAQLTASGMKAEHVSKIKEMGGPEQVDWDKLLPKIPQVQRRYIEAKLLEITGLRDSKKDAVNAAQKDADKFFADRKARDEQGATVTAKAEQDHATKQLEAFVWMKPPELKADATEEEKKSHSEYVKFTGSLRTKVTELLADQSPHAKAELAVGTAAAYFFKGQLDGVSTALKTAKEDLAKAVEERGKVNAELDRIKKASGARRLPSSAPQGGVPPKAPVNVHQPGDSALDALRSEQLQTKT